MLKKLLKYEFKAQARLLVPMLFSVVAGGILSSFLMAIQQRMPIPNGPLSKIMQSSASLLLTLLIIAIFAANLVIIFLLVQRYYKNFFTDEGYLTFTLPVTADQHIITKLIASGVWSIAAFIAFLIAVFFMLSFGTSSKNLFNAELWRELGRFMDLFWHEAIDYIGAANTILFVIESILLTLVFIPSSFIVFYYAITQGCTSVRKNKILASVGIFLLANIVIQVIRNVITVALIICFFENLSSMSSIYIFIHAFLWVHVFFYIAITAVGFFLCRGRLKKKLDLE